MSLSQYGIDEDNPADIKPAATIKAITFTVETDYSLQLYSDLPDEEIIKNFIDGKYADIEPVELTKRIYDSSIKVNNVYLWGGHANGE